MISYIHSLLLHQWHLDRHILYFIYKDTLNWNDSSFTVKCQYRFICVHVVVNIYFSAKTKNCCFSNENVTCNLTYSINLFLSLCNLLNNLRFRLITSFLILCSAVCNHNSRLSLATIYVVETSTFATKIYISDRLYKTNYIQKLRICEHCTLVAIYIMMG